jgi:hypothetical protein
MLSLAILKRTCDPNCKLSMDFCLLQPLLQAI